MSLLLSILIQFFPDGGYEPPPGPAMRSILLTGGLVFVLLGAAAVGAGIARRRRKLPALSSFVVGGFAIIVGGAGLALYYLTAVVYLEIA